MKDGAPRPVDEPEGRAAVPGDRGRVVARVSAPPGPFDVETRPARPARIAGPARRPLVFLHGIGGTSVTWSDYVEALAGRNRVSRSTRSATWAGAAARRGAGRRRARPMARRDTGGSACATRISSERRTAASSRSTSARTPTRGFAHLARTRRGSRRCNSPDSWLGVSQSVCRASFPSGLGSPRRPPAHAVGRGHRHGAHGAVGSVQAPHPRSATAPVV